MADLIFYGGTIHSMDDRLPNPEAVAILGDKIVAVGGKEMITKDFCTRKTTVVELKAGQTLMPGFIETHSHPVSAALASVVYKSCSAYDYKTKEEVHNLFVETVANIEPGSGHWCIFFGWDPEMIRNLPTLNFDTLDGYSTETPIFVVAQNGHAAWANRKAFAIGGVDEDTEDPPGGKYVRDEDGNLTGQMLESVSYRPIVKHATPKPTSAQIKESIGKQWMEYSKAGFTTVCDLAYLQLDDVDEMLEEMSARDDCAIRVGLYTRDDTSQEKGGCCDVVPREGHHTSDRNLRENEKLWIAGVKIICDGSPHCGTAATHEDYLVNDLTEALGFPEPPNKGLLKFEDEEEEKMRERIVNYHQEGTQMALHAHGERAIEQVLDAIENAMNTVSEPKDGLIHRIEHAGLCLEDHVKKAARLNVSISFFVQHLYFYGTSYTDFVFGPERANRWGPVGLAVKHNLLWTIHQDHPSFPGPFQPLANVMTAVTRTERDKPEKVYGKEYCISVEEALKGYTIYAAKQIHKDAELGSITINKKADLVILSNDPVKVGKQDPFKLVDIKVDATYLNGRETFKK